MLQWRSVSVLRDEIREGEGEGEGEDSQSVVTRGQSCRPQAELGRG